MELHSPVSLRPSSSSKRGGSSSNGGHQNQTQHRRGSHNASQSRSHHRQQHQHQQHQQLSDVHSHSHSHGLATSELTFTGAVTDSLLDSMLALPSALPPLTFSPLQSSTANSGVTALRNDGFAFQDRSLGLSLSNSHNNNNSNSSGSSLFLSSHPQFSADSSHQHQHQHSSSLPFSDGFIASSSALQLPGSPLIYSNNSNTSSGKHESDAAAVALAHALANSQHFSHSHHSSYSGLKSDRTLSEHIQLSGQLSLPRLHQQHAHAVARNEDGQAPTKRHRVESAQQQQQHQQLNASLPALPLDTSPGQISNSLGASGVAAADMELGTPPGSLQSLSVSPLVPPVLHPTLSLPLMSHSNNHTHSSNHAGTSPQFCQASPCRLPSSRSAPNLAALAAAEESLTGLSATPAAQHNASVNPSSSDASAATVPQSTHIHSLPAVLDLSPANMLN